MSKVKKIVQVVPIPRPIELIFIILCFISNLVVANGELRSEVKIIPNLGKHAYQIPECNSGAQTYFNQGLRLYYGFRYLESLASFKAATKADSQCAMTYWGQALAIKPNPNSRYLRQTDDPKGAGASVIKAALNFLPQTNKKHQKLIEALSSWYSSNKNIRDQVYIKRLMQLVKEFPEDHEISTLLAEAIMTSSAWDYWTPDGRPRPNTTTAIQALEQVIEENTHHPGANHLFIHLYEDSQTPEIALDHAMRLAKTMPNVGHMVHMPSHIYIRTGRYEESIKSNFDSIEAANRFLELWGNVALPFGEPSLSASDKSHYSHATDFIALAYYMLGNKQLAIKYAHIISEDSASKLNRFGGFQRRYVKPWMIYRKFSEWDAILRLPLPSKEFELAFGLATFAVGSAQLQLGNIKSATKALEELKELKENPTLQIKMGWVNSVSNILEIAYYVLKAEISVNQGKEKEVIALYSHAIRLEDGLNYMEPPEWGHPVRQELGHLLLTLERYKEAETIFWEDLRRNPENGWSLNGLKYSLLEQKKNKLADEIESRFKASWKLSDTELYFSKAKPNLN